MMMLSGFFPMYRTQKKLLGSVITHWNIVNFCVLVQGEIMTLANEAEAGQWKCEQSDAALQLPSS